MAGLTVAVALSVSVAIIVPHVLPLDRVAPATAACVWLMALALRALVAMAAAILVLVYLPQTGVYDAVAHWCVHEALPLVAIHLGLSGHPVIHVAMVLPGLSLAASVLWLVFGLARASLALRVKLHDAVGAGPLDSTIIADDQIVVGVTGVGRGRIVVSDGALGAMDDAELEASLNHELGHIHRRHRPLLLLGSLLTAFARPLPGTGAADRHLRFSLERDADDYAVRHTADPLALASAICKVASNRATTGSLGLGGGGGPVGLRLDYLEGRVRRAGGSLEHGLRLLAVGLVLMTAALWATLPSWALAAPKPGHTLSATDSHCPKGG